MHHAAARGRLMFSDQWSKIQNKSVVKCYSHYIGVVWSGFSTKLLNHYVHGVQNKKPKTLKKEMIGKRDKFWGGSEKQPALLSLLYVSGMLSKFKKKTFKYVSK